MTGNLCFFLLGEDVSESKDKSIIRRTLKKGEGWAKPIDGASVEVILKGTHDGKVFDDRTVTFTMGEGILQNIPHGFVFVFLVLFTTMNKFDRQTNMFFFRPVSNTPSRK